MNARTARPSGPAAEIPADDAVLAKGLSKAVAVRRSPFDSHSAMRLLFRAAQPHLSRDDLHWLAVKGPEHAEELACHMGDLAYGLGCLIMSNYGVDGVPTAGNFQSHDDLPSLLFHFAGVSQQIASLVHVSGEAAAELQERGEA